MASTLSRIASNVHEGGEGGKLGLFDGDAQRAGALAHRMGEIRLVLGASTDAAAFAPWEGWSMTLRLVLVDDDHRFRAIARRMLVAEGIDVVAEVDNGTDATVEVARWDPDVVLLDIGLPDVDGTEVARRLRDAGAGAAVILISTRDVDAGRRLADGLAAGYLPKEALSLAAIRELADAATPGGRGG